MVCVHLAGCLLLVVPHDGTYNTSEFFHQYQCITDDVIDR